MTVDLKPGFLTAKGYYHVKNPGLTLLAEVKTGLEIKKGKELWLKDTELKINRDEQTDAVRDAIRKIQPVVDIRDLPFPITLAELTVTETSLRMGTRTAPKPFEGLLLRYLKIKVQPAIIARAATTPLAAAWIIPLLTPAPSPAM